MLRFIESPECASRAHCRTCRDLNGGRAWRTSLAKLFELPKCGVPPDFACPFGAVWGGEAPAAKAPAPAAAESGARVANDAAQAQTQAEIEGRRASRLIQCRGCPAGQFRGVSGQGNTVVCAACKSCGGGIGDVSLAYGACPMGQWG